MKLRIKNYAIKNMDAVLNCNSKSLYADIE
jgi:hypothetical protein